MASVVVFSRLYLTIAFLRCRAVSSKSTPEGHMEPFGSWGEGTPIEERFDVPEPKEFWDIGMADSGYGRPVVFRGAVKDSLGMKWSTDDYMLEHFGGERIEGVEYDLKETRAGGQVPNMNKLSQFIGAYNTSDIYMVSKVPPGMQAQLQFLPCMRCGGFLRFIDVHNMWMGRGSSKSVPHYDDQDNINCMFAGRKKFVFMHPRYKEQFEAHPNTKKNKFGWVDTDLDRSIPGYGAFFKVDVDKMDLIKYPGWKDVEFSWVELQPGDCVYIPYQWYHQVTAFPERTINVHTWYWRPKKFDSKSCAVASSETPYFADCTTGYEPSRGGHFGVPQKKGAKMTKCKPVQRRSDL